MTKSPPYSRFFRPRGASSPPSPPMRPANDLANDPKALAILPDVSPPGKDGFEPDSPPPTPGRLLLALWPKTLLGRSLLIVVFPLVLLQIVATWVFYDRLYSSLTDNLVTNLASDIALIVSGITVVNSPEEIAAVAAQAQNYFGFTLVFTERGLVAAAPKPGFGATLQKDLEDALRRRLNHHFSVDAVSLERGIKVDVQIGADLASIIVPQSRLFRSTSLVFILWIFGSSFVLFAVTLLFMRSQVKPIKRLAHAAERLGRGLEVYNFRPEGAAEVRKAAFAFLQMQSRIQRQIQQRTSILAGVSHDLRTPLTRMKLELAMLPESPEVKNLQSDVAQLEHMIEDYLTFARGEGAEQPRQTNLAALLHQVCVEARRDGANIELHLEQSLPLMLRRQAVRRCLANLLSNAQRYGGDISVTARRRKKGVEVLIDDSGPGIPEDKLEAVFRPFYRLEESRNLETGGTGLGLTIARDVVRSHGGEVTLSRSPLGGLRARIRLPG